VTVFEPSAAALAAARTTHAGRPDVGVAAALPWELPAQAFDHVLLLPPTDRGSARVRAELAAAAYGLATDGVAYAAMHKDQGGKRYEREAGTLFGEVRVVARERGWRVLRLAEPRPPLPHAAPWLRFEALGRDWWALPGVFAAGRLDAGSASLLAALDGMPADALAGRTVGDLGCGVGVLAGAALARGARTVIASDDDLAAVRSSRRNLPEERARVLHSDLDVDWPADARVDALLMNPPFHLGRDVRLELPFAFLRVARRRLRPGGLLLLVANRALPYERPLADWAELETLSETGGFKVLRARR
jgi:16S rRNA (guanine1207-N2)-methyltransferase